MTAIFKKEFRSYFRSVTGFVFVAFFLLVFGLYTSVICFSQASSHFEYVFYNCGFVFLIAVPILTMRSIAEERRQKTDQLLYSLPVKTGQIVLGKYFAMLAVYAIPVAVSCLYPLILKLFDPSDNISFVAVYSAVFAFLLLGAALIAIGMFMSSLTENQIISALLSFGAMLICYLMSGLTNFLPTSSGATMVGFAVLFLALALIVWFVTKNSTAAWIVFVVLEIPVIVLSFVKPALLEGALPELFGTLSVFERFYSFANGVFDIKAIVYFVTIAVLFNFFTVQSVEKRRWS